MSGGPPHHPHNRQVPTANTAWNHLQVPNFFPTRQPQHAHMSNELPILQHPTWHTPTTEPIKNIPHSHLFNLEQMLSDRPFQRHAPGVDLSVTRNGSQNGDLPTTPMSLSVRDTNKINSLAATALEIQSNELKAASPGLKSLSPGLKSSSPILKSLSPGLKAVSPGLKSASPGLKPASPGPKPASPGLKSFSPGLLSTTSPLLITNSGTITTNTSITLKPLSPAIINSSIKTTNPALTTNPLQICLSDKPATSPLTVKKAKRVDSILERLNPQNNEEKHAEIEKPSQTATQSSSHDENSNSSSILNVPTPSTVREEEVVSPYSNEDSLDSNKSRRKRKPSKTVRVPVETDVELSTPAMIEKESKLEEPEMINKIPENTTPESPEPCKKIRRKTSSESETIDKIAAMVQETLKKPEEEKQIEETPQEVIQEPPPVETAKTTVVTVAQKKDFVAVEDKLEEMFAGLEDPKTPPPVTVVDFSKDGFNDTEDLLALENTPSTSHHDNVTSTSGEISSKKSTPKKKRKLTSKDNKKRKSTKGKIIEVKTPKSISSKKVNGKTKADTIKDVYAYDSGSNASSSKSKGPFVHIRGTRDSPLSVSVINTSVNEEDAEKKGVKAKKFHDDSEYRHKVRSKGLHCSTLSNKYDAQTKDTSWICVFCKRGPYSNEFGKLDFFYTPGDLFGPYVIMNNSPEFANRLEDPFDKQFKSKKVSRSLELAPTKTKKSKRKNSESVCEDGVKDCNFGIVPTDDHSFEIWAHEDCIAWSPGIYLVGPKILGLEEAVWTCSNVNCTYCNIKGANVCCLKRGCPSVVHLGCAYVSKWHLDEENYKAYCFEHRTV